MPGRDQDSIKQTNKGQIKRELVAFGERAKTEKETERKKYTRR